VPAWLARLVWRCRGKRRVKLHLEGGHPTVEGILLGRISGHYVVLMPILHHTPDAQPAHMSNTFEVPKERVVFVEVVA
jgi:hypothetical protein